LVSACAILIIMYYYKDKATGSLRTFEKYGPESEKRGLDKLKDDKFVSILEDGSWHTSHKTVSSKSGYVVYAGQESIEINNSGVYRLLCIKDNELKLLPEKFNNKTKAATYLPGLSLVYDSVYVVKDHRHGFREVMDINEDISF